MRKARFLAQISLLALSVCQAVKSAFDWSSEKRFFRIVIQVRITSELENVLFEWIDNSKHFYAIKFNLYSNLHPYIAMHCRAKSSSQIFVRLKSINWKRIYILYIYCLLSIIYEYFSHFYIVLQIYVDCWRLWACQINDLDYEYFWLIIAHKCLVGPTGYTTDGLWAIAAIPLCLLSWVFCSCPSFGLLDDVSLHYHVALVM